MFMPFICLCVRSCVFICRMVRKIDNQDQIVNDAVAMAIEMELKVVGKKIEVEVL